MKKLIKKIIQLCSNFIRNIFNLMPNYVLAVLLENFSFYRKIDFTDRGILIKFSNKNSLVRLESCKKEEGTVEWIKDFSKDKKIVFYDIGANVGAYSLIAAHYVCNDSKVYSFEPVSSNFTELCENIHINNFNNKIIPFNIALSNNDGIDEFHLHQYSSGSAMHVGLDKRLTSLQNKSDLVNNKFYLNKLKLDSFINNKSFLLPNYIKIDVDGHEFEILKGAVKTLKNPNCRSIIFEIDENDEITKEINDLVDTLNFKLSRKFAHGKGIFDVVYIKI